MLFGDFLNPGNCFKLALVPIPGMIRVPESAEFRRKATRLRRIAVLVFAAQKPPGKRIERNHRETFFLHQREKFSLNFTEQHIQDVLFVSSWPAIVAPVGITERSRL